MKTQWKSVSLSRHHPSILQVHCWGSLWPRTLTRDAPYLTSSPAHQLRPVAQSTMWKKKDWAKTLNPKTPYTAHIIQHPWLDKWCVCDEWISLGAVVPRPTYLVQRVEFCVLQWPKEGTSPRWVYFCSTFWTNETHRKVFCDAKVMAMSVQFTSLL
jgi:hypothetical protein